MPGELSPGLAHRAGASCAIPTSAFCSGLKCEFATGCSSASQGAAALQVPPAELPWHLPGTALLSLPCHLQLAQPCPNKPSLGLAGHPGTWCSLEVASLAKPWESPAAGAGVIAAGSGRGPGPAGALGWHCPACSGISVNTAMQRWFHCCSSSFPHFSKKPFIKGKKPKTPNQREREC